MLVFTWTVQTHNHISVLKPHTLFVPELYLVIDPIPRCIESYDDELHKMLQELENFSWALVLLKQNRPTTESPSVETEIWMLRIF